MSRMYVGQFERGVRLKVGERKTAGPIETREKLVMLITRKIHRLEAERKRIKARLKAIQKELAAQRRGLRIALQGGEDIEDGKG